VRRNGLLASLALGLFSSFVPCSASADTIVLTNGRVIEADRAWYEGSQLFYERSGAVFGLPRSLVKSVETAATPPPPVPPEVSLAQTHLDKGRVAEALDILKAALQRDARSTAALQLLASAYLAAGDNASARDAAQKAVRLDDRDPRAFALLGDAFAASADAGAAAAAYRTSLKLRSDPLVQKKLAQIVPSLERPTGPQFRLRYDGSVNEPLGVAVLEALGTAHEEYRKRLGFAPQEPIMVILQAEADFQDAQAPGWAEGVNDGSIRVPARGLEQPTPRLVAVLRHELAHSFVSARTGGNCPTWLQEGVAQWLEGGDPAREDKALGQRLRERRLMPLVTLEAPFQQIAAADAGLAYAESLSAVAHVMRLRGEAGLVRLIAALGDGLPSEEALPVAIALSYAEFERSWTEHLARAARR
jgi:tetratricopeptide (TPR) repeat protein